MTDIIKTMEADLESEIAAQSDATQRRMIAEVNDRAQTAEIKIRAHYEQALNAELAKLKETAQAHIEAITTTFSGLHSVETDTPASIVRQIDDEPTPVKIVGA